MSKAERKEELIADLANHAGIGEILDELQKNVQAINANLLSSARMSEHERDILLTKRECYEFLRTRVDNAKYIVEKRNNREAR